MQAEWLALATWESGNTREIYINLNYRQIKPFYPLVPEDALRERRLTQARRRQSTVAKKCKMYLVGWKPKASSGHNVFCNIMQPCIVSRHLHIVEQQQRYDSEMSCKCIIINRIRCRCPLPFRINLFHFIVRRFFLLFNVRAICIVHPLASETTFAIVIYAME